MTMQSPEKETELIDLGRSKLDDKSTGSEKDKLLHTTKPLTEEEGKRLRLYVLIKSWIEVVILGILSAVSLFVSIQENSPASFGFAISSTLDVVGTFVVIWRFANPAKLYSPSKEKIACIVLGFFFMASACIVAVKSVITIVDRDRPNQNNIIIYSALLNTIACVFLASFGIYLAKRLGSLVVASDAVNTVVNLILAFSTFTCEIIYVYVSRHWWYLDAIFGLICAAFLLVYGIWVIVYQCSLKQEQTEEDEI